MHSHVDYIRKRPFMEPGWCLLWYKWMKKEFWYRYTMEFYSATQRTTLHHFRKIELEIVLRKTRHTQKDNYQIFFPLWNRGKESRK